MRKNTLIKIYPAALHDHDAEALVLALVDVDLAQPLVLPLVPLHRAVLVRVGRELRQRPHRQVVDGTVAPPQDEGHVRLGQVLDERGDVEVVPGCVRVAILMSIFLN